MIREYLGYFGGYCYSYFNPLDEFIPDVHYPVTICAAKCGRWWRMCQGYLNDGLCWKCWLEQHEGEEDMT